MLSLTGDPIALAVLGSGGVLLGLAELALASTRRFRTWKASLALVALLALVGGAAYACGEGQMIGQPALLLAGVALTLLLFRSPTSIAGRPVVQGAGMVVLGTVLLGTQLYRFEHNLEIELLQTDFELAQMVDPIDENDPPTLVAATDVSRPIPLWTVSSDAASATAEEEARYLRDLRLQTKVIQTAPLDVRYNCHGWVFGNGRGWIRGKLVDSILQDNAYQLVESPRAGDVAIFRNHLGEVTHSGIVQAGGKGRILIESKWGRFGRYVHTPEDHGYRNDKLTYYRSSRNSHALTGVKDHSTEAAVIGE